MGMAAQWGWGNGDDDEQTGSSFLFVVVPTHRGRLLPGVGGTSIPAPAFALIRSRITVVLTKISTSCLY